MPCMVESAVVCSVSFPNRMKPKPLLVPISSNTTETNINSQSTDTEQGQTIEQKKQGILRVMDPGVY